MASANQRRQRSHLNVPFNIPSRQQRTIELDPATPNMTTALVSQQGKRSLLIKTEQLVPSRQHPTPELEVLQKSQNEIKRKPSRQDGVVEVGSTVPDFSLIGVDGKAHRLSNFRGKKVMLCFYRYSTCPTCAYTISKFIGHYKKLAWASKLTVMTVFQTDVESLKEGLTDADAPIRRLAGISASGYPFLGLADPDGIAASAFKVNKRQFVKWNTLFSSSVNPKVLGGVLLGGAKGENTLLPSEFLIDENGVLADAMRARKKDESMALFRVNMFLTRGFERQSQLMQKSAPSRAFYQSEERL